MRGVVFGVIGRGRFQFPKGHFVPDPIGKSISLRGLEVFEAVARTGSMQDSAQSLGLSAPAASQQLRNLETALGQPLIDHSRRPLMLTRAGRAYLAHVRAALGQLQQGGVTLSMIDLTQLRGLRLGIIDDFDSEVTPRLTVGLAEVLTQCDLSLITAHSHAILADLGNGSLDLGISARPFDVPEGLRETPLLRDPFVLAVPRGLLASPPGGLDDLGALPFLRYERGQLIARQIATHLARLKLAPEGRIELASNQAMFGLIASGAGWAVTTPLGFFRARRFQGQVDLFPLPFAGFARTISLFQPADAPDEMAGVIANTMRDILRRLVIVPGLAALPWLQDGLVILPDDAFQ